MQKINIDLFLRLNADANSPHWVELLARAAAGTPVAITAVILVGLWIWGKPTCRGPLLAVMSGLAIAFLLSSPFAFLLYTPRPFVLGVGHTLIPHAPETSFPSDHALLIWSVAFGLVTTGAGRAWGWMLVVLGVVTAWARIYLGVHFPFDMAGSFVIALLGAAAARLLLTPVERRLLPSAEIFYETILHQLNLPATVFPRNKTYGIKKVLVLCTGNSCRSVMEEALINHLGRGRYQAFSAGSKPAGYVHPKSIETLKRHGIDPGHPRSKSWDEFIDQSFELVITVCDQAAGESCPFFPGKPKKLHWSTPDPAKATGTEAEIEVAFDKAFLMLKKNTEDLINDRT